MHGWILKRLFKSIPSIMLIAIIVVDFDMMGKMKPTHTEILQSHSVLSRNLSVMMRNAAFSTHTGKKKS